MLTIFMKIIIVSMLVCYTAICEAKSLYVDGATGSDATTYSGNDSDHPWQTIGRAVWGSTDQESTVSAQAAQAGDTVYVYSGTYTVQRTKESGGQVGTYYGPNNGSSGSEIKFIAVGAVIIQQTGNGGAVWQPRNYTTIDGFTFDSANITKTYSQGLVCLNGSDNATIKNCIFDGDSWGAGGDNHVAIWASVSTNATITNNYIYEFLAEGGSQDENAAGVTIYSSVNLTIKNNNIYNCGTGIYAKGNSTGTPISGLKINNNLLYLNKAGITTIAVGDSDGSNVNKIYQNVIRDNYGSGASGLKVTLWSHYVYFCNNTVVDTSTDGVAIKGSYGEETMHHVYFYNNVLYGGNEGISFGSSPGAASKYLIDNNLVYNVNYYGSFDGVQYNESGLQAATGWQANSSTSNPLFTDYNGNIFILNPESPAASLGVDILDLDGDSSTVDNIPAGAYITGNETIGIESGDGDTTAPQRVTGVTITGASID